MPSVFFTSDSLTLEGNLFPPKTHRSIGILMLHGASNKGKYRYFPLQEFLYKNNISSFAYNTRGVGESEGNFMDSSLKNRLHDATAAYTYYKQYVDNIIIAGSSMGGYVATELAHRYPEIKGLVLIGPAAYAPDAENVLLGPQFTEIISQEGSWKNSVSFQYVREYKGSVLITYGDHDTVIPKEIQETYKACIKPEDSFVILKNLYHNFLAQENNEQSFKEGMEHILAFIQLVQG